MTRMMVALVVLAALPASADCDPPGSFRLYRSSATMPNARIHVATFDTTEGRAFNEENCNIAAREFAGKPGVIVAYWCEPMD